MPITVTSRAGSKRTVVSNCDGCRFGNGPRWTGAPAGVPVLYYEDLEEGHEKWGGEIVVEREALIAHAREFDPWPFHTDEEARRNPSSGALWPVADTPSICGSSSAINF